jgi:hypothetical protein
MDKNLKSKKQPENITPRKVRSDLNFNISYDFGKLSPEKRVKDSSDVNLTPIV